MSSKPSAAIANSEAKPDDSPYIYRRQWTDRTAAAEQANAG
jgi:hypothetical protein